MLTKLHVQVAEAMEYLHSSSIIYRDLKPQNILVWKFPTAKGPKNASIHVKLADYGISSSIGHQSITGIIGTEAYMSPEVVIHGGSKAYSFEVDVYAFGMCIYYLVAQEHPFSTAQHISLALSESRRPWILDKVKL